MAAMQNEWWCMTCVALTKLNAHGRCDTCGSDAVDRANRSAPDMLPQASTDSRLQTEGRIPVQVFAVD